MVFATVGLLLLATVIGLLVGIGVIKFLPQLLLVMGTLGVVLVIIGIVLANIFAPIGIWNTIISNSIVQIFIGFGAGIFVGELIGGMF